MKTWLQYFSGVFFAALFMQGIGFERSAYADDAWALEAVAAASNSVVALERIYPDGGNAVVNGYLALGEARMDALQFPEAEQDLKRALELHQDVFKGLKEGQDFRYSLLRRVRLLSALGDAHMQQRELEDATRCYETAINASKMGIRATSPEVKHLRTGIACCVASRAVRNSAESIFKQLLAASERASGYVQEDIAIILDAWITYRAIGERLSECEEMATRLVGVRERIHGSDHPEVAETLNRLASVLYEKGELKRALPLLERAMNIRRMAFGSDHPITQRARRNLGILREELNE